MKYSILADTVLVIHLLFIIFVIGGGLLSFRWRWSTWVHLPLLVWAILIEYTGWICPLTPLENSLRISGGETGYSGSFIEHYLLPLIYPKAMTRGVQITLGTLLIFINICIYFYIYRTRKRLSSPFNVINK